MLEQIKRWYQEFIRDMKAMYRGAKKLLTVTGVVASLGLMFHGHIFTGVVIAGITYFFWRNARGVDELVGASNS